MRGLSAPAKEMVNVSGVNDEPLWVDPYEVAAVGNYGQHHSLVVLKSGMQLTAKSKHPNEVMQLLCEATAPPKEEGSAPEGYVWG